MTDTDILLLEVEIGTTTLGNYIERIPMLNIWFPYNPFIPLLYVCVCVCMYIYICNNVSISVKNVEKVCIF